MSTSCPDENTLLDYARGSLSQHGRVSVEAHVDGCSRCRVALAAVARRASLRATASLDVVTQPEAQPPLPGQTLGERFRIVDFLGVGAMGAVYLADDSTLGEQVAVKVLAPHIAERRDVLDFLRREISLGRRVSHPNVCPVYDLGISGPHHFISMKLVKGKTLDQVLEDGPLPEERIKKILAQLASALAAAHAQGVVHRDLKAANVMLGDDDRVWVMDFGLARDIERDPSFSGPVGTPAYWAPEQALGDPATPASDVYSFGVVAYRLWTKKLPRRHREKTSFKELSPTWRPLIESCLAERMSERPADGAALVEAIKHIGERPQRRARVFGAIGLSALVSGATVAIVKFSSGTAGEAPAVAPVVDAGVIATPELVDAGAALPIVIDAGEAPVVVPVPSEVRDAGTGGKKRTPKNPKEKKEDIPIFD